MAEIHRYSENILVKHLFNGALTNGTQNSGSVDLLNTPGGYPRRGAVVFDVTDSTSTFNFQVQDSPDNSTWTSVSGGTLGAAVASASTGYIQVVDLDLSKRQRYVRVQITGSAAAGTVTATLHLFEPEVTVAPGSFQDNATVSV